MSRSRFASLALVALGPLVACGGAPPAAPATPTSPSGSDRSPLRDEAAVGVSDPALVDLLQDHWEHALRQSPEWATRLGDHRFDDRLDDVSEEAIAAYRAAERAFVERARAIDAASLSEGDQVTLGLLTEGLERSLALDACRFEEWSLSAMANPLTHYNRLHELTALQTLEDGRNLVARYRAVPQAIADTVANLRRGASQGLFANATPTRNVLAMVRGQLEQGVEEWSLLEPLATLPESWSEADREAIAADLRAAVVEGIRPAYVSLARFLEDELLPNARGPEAEGVGALPFGDGCYAASILAHTSLDRSARELHDLGHREMARINGEMEVLGERLFGVSDLAAILDRLRSDPALFFASEDEVEAAANAALAAARDRMDAYFAVLPQAPCVVRRVPDYEAPYTTVAYYRQPHPDGSKPGEFFVNTSRPETRPRYGARVLAYHEAIPGHHLQIAIAQELPEVPAFRRHTYLTAYVEGWALYTERLADEMGLYETDLDRLGMLSYEAWRAARLVVDTGVHALGWTRQQAERYMAEHTALALNNIENEVDRYIAWPGQALAYKVGQLEILRLREEAEQALAERFELPVFHAVVLTGGPLTLPMLEARVERWISTARRQPGPGEGPEG
ncbi:MAG: DUF885 family protein [Sandaracinaceae bacterium]